MGDPRHMSIIAQEKVDLPAKKTIKELWPLVKKRKEEHPEYNAEAIAKLYDITILRLPPYHCEL